MADFNEKFRVVMLQGAKGDAYDDTQLRQDINEMLANTPYIKYTEDNGFELPIETINDNSITAYSCWSSQKTAEEIANIIDDNDDALYSETTTRSAKSITESFDAHAQHLGGLALRIDNLENKAFKYSNTNGLIVDMSKYNHLMIITNNKIAFIVLSVTFPSIAGAGITINSLVGNDITVTEYIKQGRILTVNFDNATLPSFCYMLSE